MLSKAELVHQIRAEHRKRVFLIKQRIRIGNALGAFIRVQLGWNLNLPEKERETIRKQAQKIVETKGVGTDFAWIIAANDAACSKYDEAEADIEKALKKLVRQLPVWETWAKHVIGLSELGVATIVGEAGDLSDYPKKGHLYKRMGVALVDGIRQGGLSKDASAADWIEHGYNRERRARLYGFIGVPLIKCTAREATDKQDARDASPYREAYDKRKAYEVAKVEAAGMSVVPAAKNTKAEADRYVSEMCIHRRSQRYMEQRLLKHILQAWKRADEMG
jgi:hypothetical protein